ncbi:MAG: (deoxy)nucleoside triphosphate pyrophosphohydrolase [Acidobacteriia bacterium]|nr:(deoxy)nucleoside triphosphate pyrophosphohydrolase [Terriglobia bacterium]
MVAALIVRDGKILIGQRRPDQGLYALQWEFPGGKVEKRETPPAALLRELNEELAIFAQIDKEITRYEYQYPGRSPILLIFYLVTRFQGEPVNRVFHDIRWERAANLPGYDFLAGDVEFVKELANSSYGIRS